MADRDRPAWFGGLADLAVRYLWRPRHGQDDDPPSTRWAALVLVAAIVLGVGAAVFAGFRIAGGERSPSDAALPPLSSPEPASAVPIPILSGPPSPSDPAVRPPPPTTRSTTAAATTHPPAARAKSPVFQDKVITATSVITTGQSFASNRLRLTVTTGGDLVLQDQGRTVWHTGTTTGVKLVMQNDGHLVLYDASNGTVFSSGTAGNPGAVQILRADGNMVISLNGRILFQTRTGDGQ
jgi:hypothetical protein